MDATSIVGRGAVILFTTHMLAYLAVAIRVLYRLRAGVSRCAAEAISDLWAFRTRVLTYVASGGQPTADRDVAKRLSCRLDERVYLFACRVTPVFTTVMVLHSIIRGRYDLFSTYSNVTMYTVFAVLYAGCVQAILVPVTWSQRPLQISSVLAYLAMSAQCWSTSSLVQMWIHGWPLMMCRWALNSIVGTVPLLASLNLVLSVQRILAYTLLLRSLPEEQTQEASDLLPNHIVFGLYESASCLLSIWTSTTAQQQEVEEIRATLHAFRSSESAKTLVSVLQYVCTVVLCTTQNFFLTEPSPELAALLFRRPPGENEDFGNLKDSIVADDRDRVISEVAERCNEPGVCILIKTWLMDANRTRTAVHMYWSCIRNSEDDTGYIVGVVEVPSEGHHDFASHKSWLYTLREAGTEACRPVPSTGALGAGRDAGALPVPPSTTNSQQENAGVGDDTRTTSRSAVETAVAMSETRSEVDSEADATATQQLSQLVSLCDEVPYAVIDASFDRLPILRCNDAFRQIASPPEHRPGLKSLLKPGRELKAFEKRIVAILREANTTDSMARQIPAGMVQFADAMTTSEATSRKNFDFYAKTSCVIDTTALVEAMEQGDFTKTMLRVELSDVIVKAHKRSLGRTAEPLCRKGSSEPQREPLTIGSSALLIFSADRPTVSL
eukprot:TRINITY_DN13193_c0_g1_i4.p1 TRINITY_DN13193_c0_g1~~TRINITY_DN13193_c0_g1_i4.p1  ORF type:complete len:668 (+),score=63.25 TRINITY_DN13193_c0_g1_i4:116-2119(+)